jgi:hypothetical protein
LLHDLFGIEPRKRGGSAAQALPSCVRCLIDIGGHKWCLHRSLGEHGSYREQ